MFKKKTSEEEAQLEQDEISKVKDHIDPDEEILLVARQSRIRPGGTTIVTPNTIFATTKRIIIRNPKMLGFQSDVDEFSYDSITSVKLEKGILSSSVHLVIPGLTELSKSQRTHVLAWGRNDTGVIDAISKDKAEKLFKIIKERIAMVKEQKNAPVVQQQQEDPLQALKVRFAKGEITKEEFEEMKKVLE